MPLAVPIGRISHHSQDMASFPLNFVPPFIQTQI